MVVDSPVGLTRDENDTAQEGYGLKGYGLSVRFYPMSFLRGGFDPGLSKMTALSLVAHGLLLFGAAFWNVSRQPSRIHAVALVSPAFLASPPPAPPAAARPPSKVAAIPPPRAPEAQAQNDPDDLQEWWKKQVKTLRKPIKPSKASVPSAAPRPQAAAPVQAPVPPVPPVPIVPIVPAPPAQDTPPASAAVPQHATFQGGDVAFDQALVLYPDYFNRIQRKIDGQWTASGAANGAARVGETAVTVLFHIRKSGAVDSVAVEQSSGNRLFDLAAMRAVYAANPLPPLPEGMAEDTQPVHYRFVAQ